MSIGLGRYGGGVLRLMHPGQLLHWCPACRCAHVVDVHALSRDGHVIGWDGDYEKPTFGEPVRHESADHVCEYTLRAGVLRYSDACTHGLAGQARALIEFPLHPSASGADVARPAMVADTAGTQSREPQEQRR